MVSGLLPRRWLAGWLAGRWLQRTYWWTITVLQLVYTADPGVDPVQLYNVDLLQILGTFTY